MAVVQQVYFLLKVSFFLTGPFIDLLTAGSYLELLNIPLDFAVDYSAQPQKEPRD